MNIQKITKILTDSGIEENEAKIEVKMLFEHFCNYTQKDFILEKPLETEMYELVEEKARERAITRIPIQYIIGKAYFMGEYFKVTPDVLIPRDETEILVRKAIEIINKMAPRPNPPLSGREQCTVLDIGTGSGCIACTIAKQTPATVLGVDISSDALRIALDNVTQLGINNRAVFRKSDLFSKVREEEKFNIIISNPPYIPHHVELSPEVMQEPAIALRADENGLIYYRKITEQAPDYLEPNGWLMFELGIGESEFVKQFMEKDFTNIKIEKDLAGIDRIIYAMKK